MPERLRIDPHTRRPRRPVTILDAANEWFTLIMKAKTLGILLILTAIFVAVVVLTGDRDDASLVQELQRERGQDSMPVTKEETSREIQPEFRPLTDQLKSTKYRETWIVISENSNAMIRLPFPPTRSGDFPAAAAIDPSSGGPTSSTVATKSSNPGYVGADACAQCHRERHDSFVHTAHHRASGTARRDDVAGYFTPPNNTLRTRHPNLMFTVHERDDRLFQTVSFFDFQIEMPMEIVTGSAKSGQTYLYWHDDALFQSHVSYMRDQDEWIPSPGLTETPVDYARPIRTACLECHITYIDVKRPPNFYDPGSAILGISCERCHGAGRDHIEFHQAHPDEKTAKHIVHPAELSRERQLDICAQCHSGVFEILGDPFMYRPGDDLSTHHKNLNPDSDGKGGIHTTNQLTRLRKSECFQQSQMTCSTCHDPHQDQRGDTSAFTASCLGCHQPAHCGISDRLGVRIAENCVDCHMPVSDNNDILLTGSRGNLVMPMVDHYIRVDQRSSDEYLRTELIQDGL